jgi:hypothetical protein
MKSADTYVKNVSIKDHYTSVLIPSKTYLEDAHIRPDVSHVPSRSHRPTPDDASAYCLPFLLPRLQRLKELDDFIRTTLPYIVDADGTHLDALIKKHVEQSEQAIQTLVIGIRGESLVCNRGFARSALYILRDPEKSETVGNFYVGILIESKLVWKVSVCPFH